MSLNLNVIDSPSGLQAIQCAWRALSGENPFVGWDWADCWWRHYSTPRRKLLVLKITNDAGEVVGLAPWYVHQSLTRGRVIRFLGTNEVCGDRLTVLSRPQHRTEVVKAIADWLASDARDTWDLLELTGIEANNETIRELALRMDMHGHQMHLRRDLNCWHIPLPDTWEDYLKTISRARRNRTRRLLKNCVDAGKATAQMVESVENFDAGFRVLVDLHQKRRNELGEPGCFASDQYSAFHRDFARRMLDLGKLRLSWIEIGNRPAAVEYSFLGSQTIFNYQSGFEPLFADEHPGWVKLVHTLRWATESGYQTFDMLRGDEPYKASFGGQPEPLVQLRIAGLQSTAKLRHVAWCAQTTIRNWARARLKGVGERRNPSVNTHSEDDVAAENSNSATA